MPSRDAVDRDAVDRDAVDRDALDRLAEAAADLLAAVDTSLTERGAAPDHPVWPVLRRLRTLPGQAVLEVAALAPGPLPDASAVLRAGQARYEQARTELMRPVAWAGPAADRYDAQRRSLANHLAGGPESLTALLAVTAAYAGQVAEWVARTRDGVARALAGVLGSAQAVALSTDVGHQSPAERTGAAADIAVRLLGAVDRACADAARLPPGWASRLAEQPAPESPGPAAASSADGLRFGG